MASGAEAAGKIAFEERASDWGLEFRHHHGGSGRYYMVETMVGGVVVFDYDRDGDPDVFFVDGGELPGYEGEPPRSILFRNDLQGFVDVTAWAGVEVAEYGCGGTAGDVDGDGDLDLYVTSFGDNLLFLNDGSGRFTESGAEAGVVDSLWSSSAAFADPDRDGDLDLYVTSYVDFSLTNNKECTFDGDRVVSYCHPDVYNGEPDRYFVNEGGGRFVDRTEEAGFSSAVGPGLGVVIADFSGDGWPDVYVANDLAGNFFFRNRGDGTFEDLSLLSGTAFGDRSQPEAGMGVDADDLDGDGDLDVVVTNFEFESNAVYSNVGMGVFTDARFTSRVADPSVPMLGFGVDVADFDHDGDLDMVVANGHVHDNAAEIRSGSRFRQPNQVFVNRGGGTFEPMEISFGEPGASRGLATGDLDLDGDLDVVIVNSGEMAEAWENVGAEGGWLQLDLEARTSAPDGIGSRVTLTAAGSSQVREVRTASSFLSQNAITLHYGLGRAESADRLEVGWPGGRRQVFEGLPAGRRYRIEEPGSPSARGAEEER